MKLHTACFTFLVLLFISTESYSQIWSWGHSYGAGGLAVAADVATDPWGNVYSIGSSYASTQFDDTSFYADDYCFYIIKYDKYGVQQWRNIYSANQDCFGKQIRTDQLGNIYFAGSSTYGSISIPGMPTMYGEFIGKLNPDGVIQWVQPIPSSQQVQLDTDANGNCYVGFQYTLSANFGSLTAPDMSGGIGSNIGIGKFDSNGNALWVERFAPRDVGPIFKNFSLDVNSVGQVAFAGILANDIYALRLDAATGTLLQEYSSSMGIPYSTAIHINNDNLLVVGGYYVDSLSFGSSTLGTVNGGTSLFLTSLDNSGQEIWSTRIAGLGNNSQNYKLSSIKPDQQNNYFISGRFCDVAIFDEDTVQAIYPQSGHLQGFIAKYSPLGDFKWAKMIDCSTSSMGEIPGIDVAADGTLALTATFGGCNLPLDNIDTLNYQGSTHVLTAKMIGNGNQLFGNYFRDANNDTIQDFGEAIINAFIDANSTPYFGVTAADGTYQFGLDTGTFVITPSQPIPYHIVEPASQTVTFSSYDSLVTLDDFRLIPIPGMTDVMIDITPMTAVRPGFEAQYNITFKNIGTDTVNGTLSMRHNPLLSFTSSSEVPTTITSDSLSWSYTQLLPSEVRSFMIQFEVSVSAVLGTEVISDVVITPFNGDQDTLNNITDVIQTITGSYDPNDKSCSIPDTVELQEIQPDYFEYLVRFQNTGNDTAFTVIITDTISSLFDLTSLEIISTSHSMSLESYPANRMNFVFNNILLPDSSTNNNGSKGFVKYRIKKLSSWNTGHTFLNTAYIYFDFNTPIITNTTSTLVVDYATLGELQSKLEFNVFPNPSDEIINYSITGVNSSLTEVRLFGLNGIVVDQHSYFGNEPTINDFFVVRNLTPGIYFLEMMGEQHEVIKVIVE